VAKSFVTAKFTDNTREAMNVIRNAGERNFTNFIDDMGEMAKSLSPIDTGNNRNSIKSKGEWGNKLTLNFEIYTESGYGGYLELGTKKMAARPYFAPAFQHAYSDLKKTSAKDWE
jgi:HK97 gp10 family phage protein